MRTCGAISRAVVTGLAAWLMAPIPTANACTGSICSVESFLPFTGLLPANAPGVGWRPGRRYDGESDAGEGDTQAGDLRFHCVTGSGAPRVLGFHVDAAQLQQVIRFDDALVVGDQCEVTTVLDPCDLGFGGPGEIAAYLSGRSRFTVTENVPLPTALGVLTADSESHRTITIDSATCDEQVSVCGVAVEIALSPEAQPWADALSYSTLVDGQPWHVVRSALFPNVTGGSFVGRGKDVIFARSPVPADGTAPGTSFGTHTIVMRATLPGTDLMLETAPIEINLDCGDQPMPDGGEPGIEGVSDGCSCSIVGPRATHSFAWAWSLALITLLIARRVRSTRAASRRSRSRA